MEKQKFTEPKNCILAKFYAENIHQFNIRSVIRDHIDLLLTHRYTNLNVFDAISETGTSRMPQASTARVSSRRLANKRFALIIYTYYTNEQSVQSSVTRKWQKHYTTLVILLLRFLCHCATYYYYYNTTTNVFCFMKFYNKLTVYGFGKSIKRK